MQEWLIWTGVGLSSSLLSFGVNPWIAQVWFTPPTPALDYSSPPTAQHLPLQDHGSSQHAWMAGGMARPEQPLIQSSCPLMYPSLYRTVHFLHCSSAACFIMLLTFPDGPCDDQSSVLGDLEKGAVISQLLPSSSLYLFSSAYFVRSLFPFPLSSFLLRPPAVAEAATAHKTVRRSEWFICWQLGGFTCLVRYGILNVDMTQVLPYTNPNPQIPL